MNHTYIIAEIGINHNGSLENCFKLIDAAAESGCGAAKFQTFSARYMYPGSAGQLDWKDGDREYSYDIYDAVKGFELPREWIPQLIEYCRGKNIDFISSVFDGNGLQFLVEAGLRIIKLSSYTITHLPLIRACAETGLPIIMSTGGATLGETEEAVNTVLQHHGNLSLLHCSIQYPTALADCNLAVMKTLQYAFPEVSVGYSDHTIEISDAAVQSIYLGGKIVEKHVTLDKGMEGPDHFFALEPAELAQMVKSIRAAEKSYAGGAFVLQEHILGQSTKKCHEHERYMRDFCFVTLFAGRDIRQGERIRAEDLTILRPGKKQRGLDPKYLELFSLPDHPVVAGKDIAHEDPILWESIL